MSYCPPSVPQCSRPPERRPARSVVTGMVLLGALAVGPSAFASQRLGSLEFSPCDLENKRLSDVVEAECATLQVPENYAEPDGRKITLRIGLAKSQAAEAEPDPVLFLAGGPGQSAVDSYPMMAPAFARLREHRHIILIDQRGTGQSNTLKCESPEGESAFSPDDESLEAQTAFAKTCAEQLSATADLRQYTTSVAVRDFEEVRKALGVPQWNLVGGSYGTRAAQVYSRNFPESIRSQILDGVVPAEHRLASAHARNLEQALQGIFKRCRDDAACFKRFGDPEATLEQLKAELKRSPREVTYRDPKTGESKTELLRYGHLVGLVRLFAYSPETAALLPLALDEAVKGRAELLMAQSFLAMGDLGESIMHGMQLSVMCSEDLPDVQIDPLDDQSLLGTDFVRFSKAQCEGWPKGERPADFHAPMKSDIPTLLMSGEFDPVTPPAFGEQAAKGYSKGRHLIVKGRGHIVLGQGCMPRIAAELVRDLDPAKLETHCLDGFSSVPSFLNANGWTP